MMNDDYRYGEEAREANLRFVWRCNKCGDRYEDYPGYNEGGNCSCGGEYQCEGESYDV